MNIAQELSIVRDNIAEYGMTNITQLEYDAIYQQGRADAIDECKKIVMTECTTTCEFPFFPNCVECMTNKMEQLKGNSNEK